MAKKKTGGSLIYNVFNVGFTVVMFALPSVLLGYWYFYIRPQNVTQQPQVIVQQAGPVGEPIIGESEFDNRKTTGMFDKSESMGIFTESPNETTNPSVKPSDPEPARPTRRFPRREDHEMRKWSDPSGKFSVLAKFYSASGDTVNLITDDDRKIDVPISKLSESDKAYLRGVFKSKGIRAKF